MDPVVGNTTTPPQPSRTVFTMLTCDTDAGNNDAGTLESEWAYFVELTPINPDTCARFGRVRFKVMVMCQSKGRSG